MKLPLPDCLAWEIGAANVEVQSDSQVVVGHIQGEFEAQWDNMIKHLNNVHELQS
jgi:ribonuclease HI